MVNPAHSVTQPPSLVPIVDKRGMLTDAWIKFFSLLVSDPPPIEVVVPSSSPFKYTASHPGSFLSLGGVVSNLTLIRARTSISLAGITSGFVPMGRGDVVQVTYTGVPNAWFLPLQ